MLLCINIYIISEALLLCTLFELAKRRRVYQKAGDFCVKLYYIPQNFWKFSCAPKVPFREYLKLLFNIFDDGLLCSLYDGVHIIALMYSSWLVRERERERKYSNTNIVWDIHTYGHNNIYRYMNVISCEL